MSEMGEVYDLMIVGIGGQGTILASNIIGEACVFEGVTVRGAETHGMAQRGGSVETQIRIGQKFGPMIAPGTADMILSFDLMESVRYSHYLKKGGVIYSNHEYVIPNSVFRDDFPAPDEMFLISALNDKEFHLIDAKKLAEQAGSILTQNVVLLGAASVNIPLKTSSLEEGIKKCVPKKTIDLNLKAFNLGRESTE